MVYEIWLLLEQEIMCFSKVLFRGIWKYATDGKTKIIFWNHVLVYSQEIVIFSRNVTRVLDKDKNSKFIIVVA